MERRRQPATQKLRSLVKKHISKSLEDPFSTLPHIAELIAYGEITVGQLRPIGCVATACDEDVCLAVLVRRKNETLFQLLTRLDQAIAKAYEDSDCIDEINTPSLHS